MTFLKALTLAALFHLSLHEHVHLHAVHHAAPRKAVAAIAR